LHLLFAFAVFVVFSGYILLLLFMTLDSYCKFFSKRYFYELKPSLIPD